MPVGNWEVKQPEVQYKFGLVNSRSEAMSMFIKIDRPVK